MRRLITPAAVIVLVFLLMFGLGMSLIYEFVTFQPPFPYQKFFTGEGKMEMSEGAIIENGVILVEQTQFSYEDWDNLKYLVSLMIEARKRNVNIKLGSPWNPFAHQVDYGKRWIGVYMEEDGWEKLRGVLTYSE